MSKKFQCILLCLFLFQILVVDISAQNLVPNYSFEQKDRCPPDFVTFYRELYVRNWESPNIGTPDYFNACANKCGVPNNWVGSAEAYHGSAYIGLIACMQQYDEKQIAYREYIRVKLKDTLQKGQQYYASMYVRIGESCIASCNGLGMYFSATDLRSPKNTTYPMVADVTIADSKPIKKKSNWTKICGYYEAEGEETFLIIGNFLSNQQMAYFEFNPSSISTERISPMAYYYIDHVEVIAVSDDSSYNCNYVGKEELVSFDGILPVTGKMVLENLQFEFDKSTILPASYLELNNLALQLKARPYVKIELHGHTDNQGDDDYNMKLSEERALAVKDYLIRKDVSRMRLTTLGFGNTKPIADNDSEEGRSKNRRVEFVIVD